MSDPFDEWFTREPDEEMCDQHNGQPRPCPVCRLDYWEARAEALREEGQP